MSSRMAESLCPLLSPFCPTTVQHSPRLFFVCAGFLTVSPCLPALSLPSVQQLSDMAPFSSSFSSLSSSQDSWSCHLAFFSFLSTVFSTHPVGSSSFFYNTGILAVSSCMAKSSSGDTQEACRMLLLALAQGNPRFQRQVFRAVIGLLPCPSPKAQQLAANTLRILQVIGGILRVDVSSIACIVTHQNLY